MFFLRFKMSVKMLLFIVSSYFLIIGVSCQVTENLLETAITPNTLSKQIIKCCPENYNFNYTTRFCQKIKNNSTFGITYIMNKLNSRKKGSNLTLKYKRMHCDEDSVLVDYKFKLIEEFGDFYVSICFNN